MWQDFVELNMPDFLLFTVEHPDVWTAECLDVRS